MGTLQSLADRVRDHPAQMESEGRARRFRIGTAVSCVTIPAWNGIGMERSTGICALGKLMFDMARHRIQIAAMATKGAQTTPVLDAPMSRQAQEQGKIILGQQLFAIAPDTTESVQSGCMQGEKLATGIAERLRELVVGPEILLWLRDELSTSDLTDQTAYDRAPDPNGGPV